MKRVEFKFLDFDTMDEEPVKTTVLGYIDVESNIGYYNDKFDGHASFGWVSIDLATGLEIIRHANTLKECKEATHKRYGDIIKIRNSNNYQRLIDKFNNAKEKF